ncbi:hypothetical protein ABK040_009860 [Willaertia magna]
MNPIGQPSFNTAVLPTSRTLQSNNNENKLSELLENEFITNQNEQYIKKPTVFVSGLHTSGQTGIESIAEKLYEPTTVNLKLEQQLSMLDAKRFIIKSVHCGWYHSVLLTEDGKLYSCGAGYSNQSGHLQTSNVNQFCHLNTVKDPIDTVFCGGHHTIALTHEGESYVWGEGREGQLGLTDTIASTTPVKLTKSVFKIMSNSDDVKIVKAAAGGYHSIFVLSNGQVLACGKNSYGQCGVVDDLARGSTYSMEEFRVVIPTLIKKYERNQSNNSTNSLPSSSVSRLSDAFKRKVSVSTSSSFNEDSESSNTNTISYQKLQIVDCAAGAWHSILLTKDGRVFGMGDTQYGQLGLSNRLDGTTRYPLPFLIKSLQHEKIKAVSCGYFHSVFLTQDGRIYTCGWNAYGQCGTSNTRTQRNIYLLRPLLGVPIEKIACGWNHCIVISRNGTVYAFGESKHGQLGIKNNRRQTNNHSASGFEDESNYLPTPHVVECFKNIPIKDVSCGRGHTLFLTGKINPKMIVCYKLPRWAFTDLSFIITSDE